MFVPIGESWYRRSYEMPLDGIPVDMTSPQLVSANAGDETADRLLLGFVPPAVNGFRISAIALSVANVQGVTDTADFRLYVGMNEGALFKAPRAEPRFTRSFIPAIGLYLWPVFWVLPPACDWEVRVWNHSGAVRGYWAGLQGWYF